MGRHGGLSKRALGDGLGPKEVVQVVTNSLEVGGEKELLGEVQGSNIGGRT